MTGPQATVIAASIAAAIGVTGWFVGHLLASRREDRTKRLALTIERTDKQMSEFYSPLLSLLEQLDTVARVKDQMCRQEPHNAKLIATIAYKECFFPLHQQILEILQHKLHLLEGRDIPSSIVDYFHHFASENMYWRMTEEQHVATSVTVSRFPSTFYYDIKKDLARVNERYEMRVRELRHYGEPPPAPEPPHRSMERGDCA